MQGDSDDRDYKSRRRSRSDSYTPPRRSSYRDRSRSPERRRSRSPRSARDMDNDTRQGSERRAMNREIAAAEAAKRSKKDCRVYVGNLSFQVRWNDLKDFMREAGNVVFAEVLTLPNGMSKGCGVVEFSNPEEAQKAIRELNDQTLLGRALFIREDREDTARFGAAAVGGRPEREERERGAGGHRENRDSYRDRGSSKREGGYNSSQSAAPPRENSKHLYVGGLNWEVGWQDLKDLFRQAGDIIRADIHYGPDGNPRGSGSVVFTSVQDAQNAISMFDGAELNGMKLEVREERFQAPSSGPFGGGGRGGFRGGYRGGGSTGGGGRRENPHASNFNAPASDQIFVKNLPWSTSNEDLVELFQTTGTVLHAEVLYENGRSKGCGIVQFQSQEEAEMAITKFQGYSYGNRHLNLEFNARYRNFETNPPVDYTTLAPGGSGADGDEPMQEQGWE